MGRPKKIKKDLTEDSIKKDNSKSTLGSILRENKEEHYNFEERCTWDISTGSLLLDTALGGSIKPCLLRLCGNNNEGKTPQALEIIRNFLNTVPNSKAFWVIAEGRGLSDENKARCQLEFVYDYDKWEIGTVFVLESNVFELFIKCVSDLVKDNKDKTKYAFVVDSIDGLILRDDKKKEIDGNNKVAGTPMLSKKMLQSLSLGMFKYGHLMILISQVTAEIKLNKYEKTPDRGGTFSGGNSLLHGADWILEFQKSNQVDFIMDKADGKLNDGKSKPIGKWAKVSLAKAALEASRKQIVKYPIKYGKKPSGIWLEYEVCDLLLAWDMIKAKTSWLTFSDTAEQDCKDHGLTLTLTHQGMGNLRKYLEENPEITQHFLNKFKKALFDYE